MGEAWYTGGMGEPRVRGAVAVLALVLTVGTPAEASVVEDRASCPPDIPRAGYSDVYPLSPHAFDIDCLAWRSIVDPGETFRPNETLPRWEMAAWLDATLSWVQDRYADPPTVFVDTDGLDAVDSINAIRQVDITRGIGNDRFDPFGAVPRWQMALFLTRTYEAAGNELPEATERGFADIAGATPEVQAAINQLTALGVTRGTGPASFSPDEAVTREQMASFVARLLERMWVLQPVTDTCDTAVLPIRCSGSIIEVSPPVDLRVRVPMFMAEHVGDLDVAEALFADPGTRIDLFVDGTPLFVRSTSRRHTGAVYRYWEGLIPAGARGQVTVEAHTYLRGTPTTIRVIVVEFR